MTAIVLDVDVSELLSKKQTIEGDGVVEGGIYRCYGGNLYVRIERQVFRIGYFAPCMLALPGMLDTPIHVQPIEPTSDTQH